MEDNQHFLKDTSGEICSKFYEEWDKYMSQYIAEQKQGEHSEEEQTVQTSKLDTVGHSEVKSAQTIFHSVCDKEAFNLIPKPSGRQFSPYTTRSSSTNGSVMSELRSDEGYVTRTTGRISRSSVCSDTSSDKTTLPVDSKVEGRLKYLIHLHPNGIRASELQNKYKEIFELDLDYQSYGFDNLIHFAKCHPNIFTCSKKDSDWILFASLNTNTKLSDTSADYVQPFVPNNVLFKIKQLLIKKPRMTLEELEKQYKFNYNSPILYEKYGFPNLKAMFTRIFKKTNILFFDYDEGIVSCKSQPIDKPLMEPSSTLNQVDFKSYEEILQYYPADVFGLPNTLLVQDVPSTCTEDPVAIKLSEVYNPGEFYYQLADNCNALENLMNEMQNFYASGWGRYKMHLKTIVPSQYCVAIYKDGSILEWTRAQITKIISEDIVEVFFFDYGTASNVKIRDLRYLHNSFSQLPMQARRGSMAFIKPRMDKWSDHSGHMILSLVKMKTIMAIVHKFKQRDVDYLSLFETYGETDIDVGQYLIQKGVALSLIEERENLGAKPPVSINKNEKSKEHSGERTRPSEIASSCKLAITEADVKNSSATSFVTKSSAVTEEHYRTSSSENMICSTSHGFVSSYPNYIEPYSFPNDQENPLVKSEIMNPLISVPPITNPFLAMYFINQQMSIATALNSVSMGHLPETIRVTSELTVPSEAKNMYVSSKTEEYASPKIGELNNYSNTVLPPVFKVDILGNHYHIVYTCDRYYMSTTELSLQMCKFSSVHVLLKILSSIGVDIPFLIVNKSAHVLVYQALLRSDIAEPKKNDIIQSFHLTPLNYVPKIMRRLNLLHEKLNISLKKATETVSSQIVY